jgi:hypothetical protein
MPKIPVSRDKKKQGAQDSISVEILKHVKIIFNELFDHVEIIFHELFDLLVDPTFFCIDSRAHNTNCFEILCQACARMEWIVFNTKSRA